MHANLTFELQAGPASARLPLARSPLRATPLPVTAAWELEANERAAYRSLFATAAALHGTSAFQTQECEGASVFMSPLMRKAGVFNRVLGLGIGTPARREVVQALEARFRQSGCGMALEVLPQALDDQFAAALRQMQIRRSVMSAVLRRDLAIDAAAAGAEGAPVTEGQPCAQPAHGAMREAAAAICAQVFAVPPAIREVLAALDERTGWRHWIAFVDGQPAGAALSFKHDGRCWFGWAATLPEFRSRGVKGALDNARIADAVGAGCTLISSDTATGSAAYPDHSLRSLSRRGFGEAYLRATYCRAPRAGQ